MDPSRDALLSQTALPADQQRLVVPREFANQGIDLPGKGRDAGLRRQTGRRAGTQDRGQTLEELRHVERLRHVVRTPRAQQANGLVDVALPGDEQKRRRGDGP